MNDRERALEAEVKRLRGMNRKLIAESTRVTVDASGDRIAVYKIRKHPVHFTPEQARRLFTEPVVEAILRRADWIEENDDRANMEALTQRERARRTREGRAK